MYAVEQICGLYGVQYTREQSLQFNVPAAAGSHRSFRPLFIGTWVDNFGKKHNKGKPDFLARPRILVAPGSALRIAVPLWIECKSIDGKMRPDQEAFRAWVLRNGDSFLLIREDARPLIEWFDDHGVENNATNEELATVVSPMDASKLHGLPCKWCGLGREAHMGSMFGCPLHLVNNNTKLIGKVWSPKWAASRRG